MINKKEAKMQYLQKQLENPNISQYKKKQIQQRLGIKNLYSKDDFTNRSGFDLICFVSDYIDEQIAIIRKQKRTDSPIDFLTKNQTTIYYLCMYHAVFEEDSLEQLYDIGDFEEIKGLAKAFETIDLLPDAELVRSILEKKLTNRKITQLLEHFQEDDEVEQQITTEIEKFIRLHIYEIIELQHLN